MHPEVIADKPGRCPLCGMNLVLKGEVGQSTVIVGGGGDQGLGVLTWRSYIPLLQIIGGITLISSAFSAIHEFSLAVFAVRFMTFFFLVFASFKLRDLKGFAEGYATYDLLAGKVPAYGYVYPFIELSFGIAMLLGYHSHPLLWAEFFLMTFSGIGVAIKLARKEPFMCVCLGTSLKIPLTYVTLIEDFGMAGMALLLIYLL